MLTFSDPNELTRVSPFRTRGTSEDVDREVDGGSPISSTHRDQTPLIAGGTPRAGHRLGTSLDDVLPSEIISREPSFDLDDEMGETFHSDDAPSTSLKPRGWTVVECRNADGDLTSNFVVDNEVSATTLGWATLYEKGTDEEILFYCGLVTTRDHGGDLKLASIISQLHEAGLHAHTYDARSGANYRISRVGATASRLSSYADSIHYINELDPDKVRRACHEIGLVIDNGESAIAKGIKLNTSAWYRVNA